MRDNFCGKNLSAAAEKVIVGELTHLMRRVHGKSHLSEAVHIWMTESSQQNIFFGERKRLAGNSHPRRMRPICRSGNAHLLDREASGDAGTKFWLLPEFKSSSRDAAARVKWGAASNSSWSPLPLPSRTTQGLNQ